MDSLQDLTEGDPTDKYQGDSIIMGKIQDNLKQMKNRKAPGPDKINAELLKYGETAEIIVPTSYKWKLKI